MFDFSLYNRGHTKLTTQDPTIFTPLSLYFLEFIINLHLSIYSYTIIFIAYEIQYCTLSLPCFDI